MAAPGKKLMSNIMRIGLNIEPAGVSIFRLGRHSLEDLHS
jgi:hypothetical protein